MAKAKWVVGYDEGDPSGYWAAKVVLQRQDDGTLRVVSTETSKPRVGAKNRAWQVEGDDLAAVEARLEAEARGST